MAALRPSGDGNGPAATAVAAPAADAVVELVEAAAVATVAGAAGDLAAQSVAGHNWWRARCCPLVPGMARMTCLDGHERETTNSQSMHVLLEDKSKAGLNASQLTKCTKNSSRYTVDC